MFNINTVRYFPLSGPDCRHCVSKELTRMTDRDIVYILPTKDESKDMCRRDSMLSQKKLKHKKRYGRKHSHSSSTNTSLHYGKDVGTPKHRSRIRFNGFSNGDSPNEAENLQDIIWDSASPPSLRKGKEAGESIRVVEISEIVNKIAPNDEKSVNKDSVLQWIGDTAIPWTPEIQPRVWQCSPRQHSNNVEDLIKLAKQFDLNMTRQHKELSVAQLQKKEGTDSKDLKVVNNLTHPSEEANELSHEEELHALFDGPTQHLSGILSPPSANCSQEMKPEKNCTCVIRPDTSDSKNFTENGLVSNPYFVDDWENDDLLSDLLVLEMTQNPHCLSSCTIKTSSHTGSSASRTPTTVSSCGSRSRTESLQSQQVTSYFNGISSEIFASSKNFRSYGVHSGAVKQLPTTSSDLGRSDSGDRKVYAMDRRHQIVITSDVPGDSAHSVVEPGKNFDTLWGNGDDSDDDLFYQACDDMEQISVSQEEQIQRNSSIPTHSSFKELSSAITTNPSSLNKNSRTVQAPLPTDHKVCAFTRSHSVPGTSGVHANTQYLSEAASTSQVNNSLQNSTKQNNFTQLRHVVVPYEENSHLSTFKRHRSDPGAFRNKVFIQPAVKCSAAEIERKKQEAIARRRLRMQTTQKPTACAQSTI